MLDDLPDDRMLRVPAAAYLSKLLGRPVTPAGLGHLARSGGGPPFVLILNKATYRRRHLNRWAVEIGGEPTPTGGRRRRRAEEVPAMAE